MKIVGEEGEHLDSTATTPLSMNLVRTHSTASHTHFGSIWGRGGETVSNSGRDHFDVVLIYPYPLPLDKINWGPRGSGPYQVQIFVYGQEVKVTWKLSVPSFETASGTRPDQVK